MAKSSITTRGASKEDVRKTKQDDEATKTMEVDRVGAILYNERMKKNADLAEISKKLCIRKYYLEAIEKGEYNNLPSMPYSAGFVDAYAKYLGLNNARITQLFREEIQVKPETVKLVVEEAATEARMPKKLYVLLGILMIVLLAWLWRYTSPLAENSAATSSAASVGDDVLAEGDVEYYQTVEKMLEDQNATMPEESDKTQEPELKQPEQEKENPKAEEPAKEEVVSGLEIKITKENTWLEVKDDKKVYVSRILKAGESYRLPETKGLILSAGKYEGVEVYVDGKLIPVFSKNRKLNIKLDSLLENH